MHVSMIACAISFVFMVVSWTRAFWIMYREAKQERSDPHVTRSEVQDMIDEAISRALGAKKQ